MCNTSTAITLKEKYFSLHRNLPHPYPMWRLSSADQPEFKKKKRQTDRCSIQKYTV